MNTWSRGMRLGTKIALYTIAFGAVIGLALTLGFSQYTRSSVLAQARIALEEQAHQSAHFVDAVLTSRIEIAHTLSVVRSLVTSTQFSNAELASLSDETRSARIQELNDRWQDAESVSDPFIKQYLTNEVALGLSQQMLAHPGLFGEIFLTNRYGALIASTGKLTTLAHGHKYWWLAAYNEGHGAVYVDDRGYDASVGDYVLGVVVPVFADGEVVGILKCNFSILTAIGNAISESTPASGASVLLARATGLVVYGEGLLPLQSSVSHELVALVSESERTSGTVRESGIVSLVAFCEVSFTADHESVAFGGTVQSVDHSVGNASESWLIIVTQNMNQVLAPAQRATMRMALIAAGAIVSMVLVSLMLGWRLAAPAHLLATQVQALGSGALGTRVDVTSKDEIGKLASSFNQMASRLETTMVSKEKLSEEVEHRKRVEDVLRESEERFRALYEEAPLGYQSLDSQGIIVEVNKPWLSLLGYKKEEVLGKWFGEFLAPDQQEKFRLGFPAIKQQGEVVGVEFTMLKKSGTPLQISIDGKVGHGIDGSVKQTHCMLHDVGAQRDLEAHLRQRQKLEALGTMASGVAHEINNPLMGMINYADLIKERAADDQTTGFAGEIMKEGNRIAMIVRNLLSFSRQDREGYSLARIADIIDGSLSLVGSLLRKDQISVEVDIPEDLPKIECRSQQIQQVVVNLLTNAHDALNARYPEYDTNKIICISAHPFTEGEDAWIRITVLDHGAGMSEDVALRIFDPFYTTKSRYEGTGLGLSVSFGIVREHHGELTVESRLGIDTQFHIDLPVEQGSPFSEGKQNEA